MKKLFHFDLQSQKQTSAVRCNTRSLKRFWVKVLICLSLSCLLLVSSCGVIAVTQEQQARKNLWGMLIFDNALGTNISGARSGDTNDYFGGGRARWDSNWTNPAVTNWILNGGNPPWAMGGGGKPQPAQTTESCKPIGASCLESGECCSRNCNNNTNRCQ